jgi:hypothetical protein
MGRSVTINHDAVTGHVGVGGVRRADVEEINTEVAKFLDMITYRGGRLR